MIYVIVGPTGGGKTKVSIELAKQIDAEIISGDAYQVYRQLNIATDKITKTAMDGIPHHLIDSHNLDQDYNVKEFQRLARVLIEEIHARNKHVIVCGGTGLYIKALLYDYVFHEQEFDGDLRENLMEQDANSLYEKLMELDSKSANEIHPNNKQRVIRAIEIAMSGTKKSEIIESQEHKMLYVARIVGLTMEREQLYIKINDRVDGMIKSGLQEEVETVLKNKYPWNLQSLQTIGFKEWKAYYDNKCSLEEVVERIKKDTRNFAKRQYTWFRNQMDVTWYDVEGKTAKMIVHEILNT